MTTTVVKRDGCQVAFDQQRIAEAIRAAARAAQIEDNAYCMAVARQVSDLMTRRERVDIHEIQQAVEDLLMAGRYPQLARQYIEDRKSVV